MHCRSEFPNAPNFLWKLNTRVGCLLECLQPFTRNRTQALAHNILGEILYLCAPVNVPLPVHAHRVCSASSVCVCERISGFGQPLLWSTGWGPRTSGKPVGDYTKKCSNVKTHIKLGHTLKWCLHYCVMKEGEVKERNTGEEDEIYRLRVKTRREIERLNETEPLLSAN